MGLFKKITEKAALPKSDKIYVEIVYGVYQQRVGVAPSFTVKDCYDLVANAWGLPLAVTAHLNDSLNPSVPADHVAEDGDTIYFFKTSDKRGAIVNDRCRVKYGVYNTTVTAGVTVQDLYDSYWSMWGIPSDAVPYKGSNALDFNYKLEAGDVIEWHRRMSPTRPQTQYQVKFPATSGGMATPRTATPQKNYWPANIDEKVSIGEILAVRAFTYNSEHGKPVLKPVTNAGGEFTFRIGINNAACRFGCTTIPNLDCSCGFYCRKFHANEFTGKSEYLQGVVHLSGRVIEGSRGYRAEKLKIVALMPANNMDLAKAKSFCDRYGTKLLPAVRYNSEDELKEMLADLPEPTKKES